MSSSELQYKSEYFLFGGISWLMEHKVFLIEPYFEIFEYYIKGILRIKNSRCSTRHGIRKVYNALLHRTLAYTAL